jgi:MFS family permease
VGQRGAQLSGGRPAAASLRPYSVAAGAAVSLSIAIAPTFLIGALALPLRSDLGLSRAGVGGVLAAFMGVALVAAPVAGRLVDHRGVTPVLRAGLLAVVVGGAWIWSMGGSQARLVAGVMICGAGLGLVDAAANMTVVRRVPHHLQAVSFGVKELGAPAATLVCGVLVVPLAGRFSWRLAFLALALAAVAWTLATRSDGRIGPLPEFGRADAGGPDVSLAWAAVLSLAMGLSLACTTAITTYGVDFGSGIGLGATVTGRLLAGASVGVVLARLTLAYVVSRREAVGIVLIPVMLGLGGLGHMVLAEETGPATFVGILLGLVAGYGWGGTMFLFLARMYPVRTGRAGGLVFMGAYAGAVVGTPAFGWLVDHHGFPTAWHTSGGCAMVAAALTAVSLRRSLRR